MEFLITTAHQLGLAVENLRLVEQILRSHRQWTNTFDSIHDLVLLHDSEIPCDESQSRTVGTPPSGARRRRRSGLRERAAAQYRAVDGMPLLRTFGRGFPRGPDPGFGGFSMVSTSSYVEQGSKQKGTIHVVRDTTDRRIAEEKYHLLFEQMQEGVFVATPRATARL